MPQPRVIIDCDPGHDDVLAIALAAASCDVVGITVVAGNAGLSNTVRNALVAADLFGLQTVPVHAGADRAMVATNTRADDPAGPHGGSGLDGPAPREPSRAVTSHDAIGFLVDAVRTQEGLWLIPTGPLTNVALALRAAPDLASRLAGISLMGGSASFGNVTATAEFNVLADPEAAAIVFDCGAPIIRMCGLNLTNQVLGGSALIARLDALPNAAGPFCARLVDYYRTWHAKQRGIPTAAAACPLHDPCAVAAVTNPEWFEFARRRVDVELRGAATRGMTVVDERGYDPAGRRQTDVAYGVRAEELVDTLVLAIAAAR